MSGAWLIFRLELRGVSRSPWVFVLRVLYPLALLSFLAVEYDQADWRDEFGLAEAGALAGRCCDAVMVAQLRAVLLVTPLVVSGTFADERRRGTLDLLLTTHLTRAEIVLGKVAARLVVVATALLGGLPVLAALTISGGVSGESVAAGSIQAAAMVASLGGVSAAVATRVDGRVTAVVMSWVVYALPGVLCCGCLFLSTDLYSLAGASHPGGPFNSPFRTSVGFATLHLAFAVAALTLAVEGLNRQRVTRPTVGAGQSHPPVGDDPYWWREWTFDPAGRGLLWMVTTVVVALLATGFLAAVLSPSRTSPASVLAVAIGGPMAVASVLAVGGVTAVSVTRERAAGRLDDFRALPDGPRLLLRAKWWAALLFAWPSMGLTAVGLCICTLHGAAPVGVVLALALLAFGVGASAGLGVWLSARSDDSYRAGLAWAACAGVGIVLPGALVWGSLFMEGPSPAAVAGWLVLVVVWGWAARVLPRSALRLIETG